MTKGRLEAFSDGVIAVLITILVLELHTPHGADWSALQPLREVFLAYVLSFVFLGIYWSNHHHMLHATERVNGAALWANLHLLFWLSLVPFVTGWVGQTSVAPLPAALYGVVFLGAAVAYTILQAILIREHGPTSKLAAAVKKGVKEQVSLALYAIGIPLAFYNGRIAVAIYASVAAIWLVPDRRIEATLRDR
jgi:TMEM175 potassium channel family protein